MSAVATYIHVLQKMIFTNVHIYYLCNLISYNQFFTNTQIILESLPINELHTHCIECTNTISCSTKLYSIFCNSVFSLEVL